MNSNGERQVVRAIRPYTDEADFLEAEAWSIGRSSFLLLDHPALEKGQLVRCEVRLENGQPLIRAEGIVVRYVEASADRPGGPQIRVQRMTPSTKAFFTRALESKDRLSTPELRDSNPGAAVEPTVPDDVQEAQPPRIEWRGRAAQPSADALARARRALSVRAVRTGALVRAPDNRNDLLSELRRRRGTT